MQSYHASIKAAVLGLIIIFQVHTSAWSHAQSNPFSQSEDGEQSGGRGSSSRVTNMLTGTIAMEGAIDPAAYVIGPGDVFTFSVSGIMPANYILSVTPDGHLTLPNALAVRVAGMTLEKARAEVVRSLKAQYRNVEVGVALVQPRQFFVHVAGAVPLPGRYLTSAVSRVSEVLELAFADTTNWPVANTRFQPSLRNITLVRKDGSQAVDLRRYLATGDPEYNPYLQDGDVISVPAYRPEVESVFIDGDVPNPGGYDYRPGDTVEDLLAIGMGNAGGPTRSVAVRVIRFNGGRPDTLTIGKGESYGNSAHPLQPLDHVFVMSASELLGTVTIEGRVRYPGTYPIVTGKTTLKGVIEAAGGLRPDALLRGAVLERYTTPAPEIAANRPLRFDANPADLRALRPDSSILMQRTRLSSLDFLSRNYLAQELRLQNRVSIDLEKALHSDADAVYLQPGDKLIVPRDDQSVFVIGQVNRPGFVAVSSGRPAEYYIDEAGGRSSMAGQGFVIKAGSGRFVPLQEADVQSGDWVFLDRRADYADTADLQRIILEESRLRAEAKNRVAQIAVSATSAVATLILAVFAVFGN